MKFAFTIITALISFTAFSPTTMAATENGFRECNSLSGPVLSRVSDVRKLQEDAGSVTFTFYATYGYCRSGVFSPAEIAEDAAVISFSDKLVLFQADPLRGSVVLTSPDQAQLILTLNKNKVFKNSDVASFEIYFYPTGSPHPRSTNFPVFSWKVVARQLEDNSSDVTIISLK